MSESEDEVFNFKSRNSWPRELWLKIKWRVIEKKNDVRHYWQRLTRGYSVNDLWDCGPTNIVEIAPRVIAFCKQAEDDRLHGYPAGLDGEMEEWKLILGKIKRAFELQLTEDEWFVADHSRLPKDEWFAKIQKNQDDINEGLRLFGEWCLAMWN